MSKNNEKLENMIRKTDLDKQIELTFKRLSEVSDYQDRVKINDLLKRIDTLLLDFNQSNDIKSYIKTGMENLDLPRLILLERAYNKILGLRSDSDLFVKQNELTDLNLILDFDSNSLNSKPEPDPKIANRQETSVKSKPVKGIRIICRINEYFFWFLVSIIEIGICMMLFHAACLM